MLDQVLNSLVTSFWAPEHTTHALSHLSHDVSSSFLFGSSVPVHLSTVSLYSASAAVIATSPSDAIVPSDENEGVFSTLVKKSSVVCIAADSILLGSILFSWGLPCDANLVTWAAGAIFFSFPSSYLVDRVCKDLSFRKGFLLESTLNIASFGWLCYGFVLMGNGPHCVDTAPLLWWPAFSEGVVGMSVTGTGIFCLITATVLSLAFGADQLPSKKN